MAIDSVLYTLRLWQREYSVLIARVTEKQAVGAPRIAHSYFRLMKWPLGKLAPTTRAARDGAPAAPRRC